MRSCDGSVAFCAQSSGGLHVGMGADTSTSLPLACGSQRTNSELSANRGSTTVVAVTSFPPVPGLYPTIVPSSDRTRGATRSMCDVPRRQTRQVPYCSFFASIPQLE